MKKLLLSVAFAALTLSSNADNSVYFFSDQTGEFAQMGSVYCISPNGEYAVIYDDEMEESFLWRRSNPTELESLNLLEGDKTLPTQIRAVANDGTIVGSYRVSAQWHPFVKSLDGEVINLPMAEWALTLNYASAISDNGDIIGGELGGKCICIDGSSFGQARPAMWVKGSDGEYELFAPSADELTLPEHQGTFVMGMYSDGTYDNSYLYGLCGAGIASYIPFVYNKGEIKFWHKIDHVEQPWYYKGKEMGRVWVETIDGMIDYEDTEIMSGLYGSDSKGNIYGHRAIVNGIDPSIPVEDVARYGKGTLTYKTGYYNVYTGEWTEKDTSKDQYYTTGAMGQVLFDNKFNMYPGGMDGLCVDMASATGLEFSKRMNGVDRMSADGRVLSTSYTQTGEDGAPHNYAVIITLDAPLVDEPDSVQANPTEGHVILAHGGTLEVIGAENVAVYDLDGKKIAEGNVSQPACDIVIVIADGVTYKVAIR